MLHGVKSFKFLYTMMCLLRSEKLFAIFLIFIQNSLDIFVIFPYNSRPQTLIGLELRFRVWVCDHWKLSRLAVRDDVFETLTLYMSTQYNNRLFTLIVFKTITKKQIDNNLWSQWFYILGHMIKQTNYGEFDPGSEWTLAACLTHASRTMMEELALPD